MKQEKNAVNKTGFTLIELLIVVLIIGMLSAIALPGYRKAVERSRVSDALTTMGAVAKSEHAWYLEHSNYTDDFANLDIDLTDADGEKADGESFDSINYTFTLQENNIKAERNNGEYTLYKMYEDNNIYCLPSDNHICEQFLEVNKNVCNNAVNGFWANKTSTCYNSEEDRCDGVEMNWAEGINKQRYAFCGYYNTNEVKIEGFGVCGADGRVGIGCLYSTFTGSEVSCTDARNIQGNVIYTANNSSCSYSQFNEGATCNVTGSYACSHNEFNSSAICTSGGSLNTCQYSTFTGNSKCMGGSHYTSCAGSTFYAGSECISSNVPSTAAKNGGSCNSNIFKTGSKCIANNEYACINTWVSNQTTTFEPGSFCVGEAENSCKGFSNFQATCVANAPGACAGNTYSGAGCCKGNHCPVGDGKVVLCDD